MGQVIRLEMELPDELVDQVFEQELLQEFRGQTALRLFQQGRVSSGYAARLVGTSRLEFLRLLEERGIPLTEYTDRDFHDDAQTLREVRDSGDKTPHDGRL